MASINLAERVLVVGKFPDGSVVLRVESDAVEAVFNLLDPSFDDLSSSEVVGVLMVDGLDELTIYAPDAE